MKWSLDEADETWMDAMRAIHNDRRTAVRAGSSLPGLGIGDCVERTRAASTVSGLGLECVFSSLGGGIECVERRVERWEWFWACARR